MSTETINKKIKIDNGTTFGKTYTDKAMDERLQGLVSTATFTPVKEKANNSLQKPKGMTETVLIAVGRAGQEIISIYTHFITLTNSTSTFYFNYQSTSEYKVNTLDKLKIVLAGKFLLCTGHTDTEKAEYISGERDNIVVGVVDNSDNSTSGITIDSSYTISDDISPLIN